MRLIRSIQGWRPQPRPPPFLAVDWPSKSARIVSFVAAALSFTARFINYAVTSPQQPASAHIRSSFPASMKTKGPVWDHVTLQPGHTDRQPKLKCNYCSKIINGSITRALAHLLSISGQGTTPCPDVPDAVKVKLQASFDRKRATKRRAEELHALDEATALPSRLSSGSCEAASTVLSQQRTITELLRPNKKLAVRSPGRSARRGRLWCCSARS